MNARASCTITGGLPRGGRTHRRSVQQGSGKALLICSAVMVATWGWAAQNNEWRDVLVLKREEWFMQYQAGSKRRWGLV